MILVTGATGSIGTALTRLLPPGTCTALVRDEAKGQALGCPFVVGDFDEPDSVAAAMRGVDALFLNAAGAQPTDGEQPMVGQQKRVIDAARAAGVSYIVKVSVLGAKPGGKLATGAHWEIEQYLKAAGIRWSILRPNGFMQNFITGAGLLTNDGDLIGPAGDSEISYIDCADIAACAAALLTTRDKAGETFVLTGPAALSNSDIAGKLTVALGRTVRYLPVPAEEMAAGIKAQGLPARFADDVAALWAETGDGSLAPVTPAVRQLTGRDPRTFDEFLADLPVGR
ncbi:MAG: NAD(P)H-binding protein [Kibdelosporangium sp.]